jgi:hypothetical protein
MFSYIADDNENVARTYHTLWNDAAGSRLVTCSSMVVRKPFICI